MSKACDKIKPDLATPTTFSWNSPWKVILASSYATFLLIVYCDLPLSVTGFVFVTTRTQALDTRSIVGDNWSLLIWDSSGVTQNSLVYAGFTKIWCCLNRQVVKHGPHLTFMRWRSFSVITRPVNGQVSQCFEKIVHWYSFPTPSILKWHVHTREERIIHIYLPVSRMFPEH